MTTLEKIAGYQQLVIRLLKMVRKYGAHLETCEVPCSCGYSRDVKEAVKAADKVLE